jgi:hypothetical protein
VYYALHHYKDETTGNNNTTDVLGDLILPAAIIKPFCIRIDLMADGGEFLVTATSRIDGISVAVRDDRLLTTVLPPIVDKSSVV